MFEIKYRFAKNQPEVVNDIDELALRYEFFLGSLWLEKNDTKLSMDWNWIPLLDFALCLKFIYNQLSEQVQGEEIFDFTESDATIAFRRDEDKCEIVPSFSNRSLMMSFIEFQEAVQLFCEKVITDILSKNKKLKNNVVFKNAMENAGLKIMP